MTEKPADRFTRLRSSVLMPFIVLGVCLATTAISWLVLLHQDEDNARAEVAAQAHQSADEIRKELTDFVEVLQAGAGLLAASDTVSPAEWRRFIERLDLPNAYPGIESLNYAARIGPDDIAALTQSMRAQGNADFTVWPEGAREEHAVTVLVEPFGTTNPRARGFDLMSEPTRRHALERARDTGDVSLSGRVNLLVDTAARPRPALLLFVPVYRGESAPGTIEERRAALAGYVTAALHIDDVVADVLKQRTLPLSLSIWEGERATPDTLLYSTANHWDSQRNAGLPTFSTDVPLAVSGQHWLLRFNVRKSAAPLQPSNKPLIALAAGIPLSLLFFGIAWSETTLRARATRLAKEMTEAVRQQAKLFDLTHDAVVLRDRDDVIRYWNRAASDTYGFSAEEASGRTVDELLKTRYPEPIEHIRATLARAGRWEGELVHVQRDGTEILVASRWAVQLGDHGQIDFILETNNDITERRRLEASLLQAQKLEAMGTLAGGVAHDFNNILGAVLGYGELARGAVPPESAVRRYVDSMMSAGQRAKSLVERILAFSRSGVGPRVLVHVQSVVVETLEMLSVALPDNITVEQSMCADDAAVCGDATQIHQVVLNLCTNAAQAMKSGGRMIVRLDVVSFDEPHTVITGALPSGPYVRLCVQDSGSGIEPHLRDRIFDPFFTTKGVGVGTGLGLSLVHGIVTDLAGGVDMASEMDRGTTFSIYLPQRGQVDPVSTEYESVPRGNGAAVLLVDDEEVLVRLGEEIVASLGYEATGFVSAVEALEEFRANPQRFAAVLSDETMPGMTGTQLTGKLVAIRPDIPVILMSGHAGPALSMRARTAGARDVLAKPLAARDIARALANVISPT